MVKERSIEYGLIAVAIALAMAAISPALKEKYLTPDASSYPVSEVPTFETNVGVVCVKKSDGTLIGVRMDTRSEVSVSTDGRYYDHEAQKTYVCAKG